MPNCSVGELLIYSSFALLLAWELNFLTLALDFSNLSGLPALVDSRANYLMMAQSFADSSVEFLCVLH